MLDESLQLSPRISVAPVLHGSGDFAVEVRRILLAHEFDCLAVPLPPSFQTPVEQAIDRLPNVTAVIQEECPSFSTNDWTPHSDRDEEETDAKRRVSYVPVDPCQPVIAALRVAIQERTPRAFIDLETDHFESHSITLPDPYALKCVSIERFAAAALLGIPRPPEGLPTDRIRTMVARLKELETRYERILFVCALSDWPWIREAYTQNLMTEEEDTDVEDAQLCSVAPNSLLFMLGELPFLTGLYEQARAELDSDENLSVDGLKQLLLASRDRYQIEMRSLARRITPKLMSVFLRYVRNLSLIERRMTPDLYTLIVAARQVFGDSFAIELAEVSRSYPYVSRMDLPEISFGIDIARLPDGGMADVVSRLPGPPVQWRSCELNAKPPQIDQDQWKMRWNPHRQCSWPPEDVAVENFRNHVKETALSMMGAEMAQTEKFSASMKDGLDIRETLRNWHTGDLYVKVYPPQLRGTLDCVLMFFDSPADPRDYPWRITWMAEHNDESTLSLFASDFQNELVGPGIGLAKYGGAMFLFPPREIMDVWHDFRLDFTDTLEERLLAGACMHSHERHIAILSELPPGAGWRRLAKRFGKKLVHVPLGRFSQETIQRLRMVHVLNGQEVRSFAAHFIRGS
jgi:hypothetical protein